VLAELQDRRAALREKATELNKALIAFRRVLRTLLGPPPRLPETARTPHPQKRCRPRRPERSHRSGHERSDPRARARAERRNSTNVVAPHSHTQHGNQRRAGSHHAAGPSSLSAIQTPPANCRRARSKKSSIENAATGLTSRSACAPRRPQEGSARRARRSGRRWASLSLLTQHRDATLR
jgi:hypothetical protein